MAAEIIRNDCQSHDNECGGNNNYEGGTKHINHGSGNLMIARVMIMNAAETIIMSAARNT